MENFPFRIILVACYRQRKLAIVEIYCYIYRRLISYHSARLSAIDLSFLHRQKVYNQINATCSLTLNSSNSFVFLEAVEVILRYSKSSQELIGRKKVKADVLFRYLQSVGVNVSPKSSKTELVGKTLDLWRESSTAVAPNPSQVGFPLFSTIIV